MSNEVIIAGVASQVISYRGQRVCTTQQLAKFYGCNDSHIVDSHRKNTVRFEEGKH